MNQFPVFLSLFLLLLCYGCGKAGRQTEIMRHQKYLLHALTTNNMASLRQEQRYVSDTLSVDSLSASPYMRDYLCAWVNSYCFHQYTAEDSATSGSPLNAATEQISADVKRLAVRLLDAGKEKQLEEILRIVSGQLLELGMNNAAAVTAAAAMGVEANAACPGDIAYRLLTRLLLVGKKAPRLSHAMPSVSTGPTLLLFYETDCPNCEAVLRDLCGFYPTLKDKNIRVISIASDDNEETFVSRAASLPWAIKWYEPQVFYSSDFESYGVAFTPTLVVVDSNGCVVGSYRTLEETTLIRSEL